MSEGRTPLHPLEEKVLSALAERSPRRFEDVVSSTGLLPDQVRRALSWLSSKGLVSVEERSKSSLRISAQPPELLLLEKLGGSAGSLPMEELKRSFSSGQEFTAAVGRASSSGWIAITSGPSGPVVRIKSPEGASELRELLAVLTKGDEARLNEKQRDLASELLRRKILERTETTTVTIGITQAGRTSLTSSAKESYVERLTPEVIASIRSSGKTVKLRPIDVAAPASGFFPGRRHPVKEFIDEVREVYLSMGFTEIVGDSVQSSFWNFDALFTPQDHPARELQDTFYVKGGTEGSMRRTGVVARVAAAHEDGGGTGSRGWRYSWDVEEARRLVLRTHNTALTIKATMDSQDRETRVFSVGRVYRNESLDYKHLAEFHQMEGIVVGEGLNLRHLIGLLTRFYEKLGMKETKLWPTYFPYTEPSMQVMFYNRKTGKWLEMGGSGIFRPEVTGPLGVSKTVLAWGLGLERVLSLRLGVTDLREFYNSDLEWLRRRREIASTQDIL